MDTEIRERFQSKLHVQHIYIHFLQTKDVVQSQVYNFLQCIQ